MKELFWSALGFLIAVGLEWGFKDRVIDLLSKTARKLRRRTLKSINPQKDNTILLGERDTKTCLIDGNGIDTILPENIFVTLHPEELKIPKDLQPAVDAITCAQDALQKAGRPHAWNGPSVHLERFSVGRTLEREDPVLHLYTRPTRYFHLMATSYAIHEEFLKKPNTALRDFLIKDFSNWRFEVPPRLANGLPLNLFVLTEDGNIIFTRRSMAVAVGSGDLTFTVNENFHPDHDFGEAGAQLNVKDCITRAVRQELGWSDLAGDGPGKVEMEAHILSFGIHTGTCCFAIMGYLKLPCSTDELKNSFFYGAKDRMEIQEFIPVPFRMKELCRFLHENNLYEIAGVGAVLALMHAKRISASKIEQEFLRLQRQ